MNIQSCTLNTQSLVALSPSNEQVVLPFCLADYEVPASSQDSNILISPEIIAPIDFALPPSSEHHIHVAHEKAVSPKTLHKPTEPTIPHAILPCLLNENPMPLTSSIEINKPPALINDLIDSTNNAVPPVLISEAIDITAMPGDVILQPAKALAYQPQYFEKTDIEQGKTNNIEQQMAWISLKNKPAVGLTGQERVVNRDATVPVQQNDFTGLKRTMTNEPSSAYSHPIELDLIKEPGSPGPALIDSNPRLDQKIAFEPQINLSRERSTESLVIPITAFTAPPEINLNNISFDRQKTGDISQNTPDYALAMDDLAHFINKKITLNQDVTSQSTQSTAREGYGVVETKSDLRSSEYKAGDAGIALKIEAYTAKIKIYPPDLGQVTAEIIVNKGLTDLTLTTENRHVTDFIKASLHELHEKFLDSNINLNQVTIQNGTSQDRQNFPQHQASSRENLWQDEAVDTAVPLKQESVRRTDSLIDTYA